MSTTRSLVAAARAAAPPAAALVALVTLAAPTPAAAQPPARALALLRIVPSGDEVPAGQQIVLQFDRPMVPLGRMERTAAEVPVEITPALPCEWRWLDVAALACRLPGEVTFALATRYDVRLLDTFTARDGARLPSNLVHHFTTRRPAIERVRLREWKGPAWPQLVVFPNQPLAPGTLAAKLWLRDARGARTAVSASSLEHQPGWWLVEPAAALAEDSAITLVLDPGLASMQGPLPGEGSEPYELHTFPRPRFLGVVCAANSGEQISIRTPRDTSRCSPLQPIALEFSAPVSKDDLARALHVTPDLAGGRADDDPWQEVGWYSQRHRLHHQGDGYRVQLPFPLRAAETYRLKAAARRLADEFGRRLENDIDVAFATDHRPARAVLTHPVSVLERGVDTHVPLVVTNLERVPIEYQLLTTSGLENGTATIELPRVQDVAYAVPLEARRWLGDRSGVVLGRLDLPPGVVEDRQYRFHTQVTPFQVHAKLGHRNTLVWVTDLSSGEPVRDATVTLYRHDGHGLAATPDALAIALTDHSGVAMLPGSDQLDPDLALDRWTSLLYGRPILFARVEKGRELALLPLQNEFQVEASGPNDTWIPRWAKRRFGHLRAFGTTAQGVYRLGSTIDYKIWVRDEDNRELVAPPPTGYDLRVIDPQGKEVHTVADLRLSEFGAAHGSFKAPENGVMGYYSFELRFTAEQRSQPSYGSEDYVWQPMSVLVTDFTPAPFRVTTDLDADRYVAGDHVAAATSARLHSGGPYGAASARLVARVFPQPIESGDPRAQGFWFETTYGADTTVFEHTTTLDQSGAASASFTLDSPQVVHGRLEVESGVRDDRGKSVAGRGTARYHGRDRYVGILQRDWVLESGQPATVEARVLDALSDQVAGEVAVTIVVEHLETKAARVKGAGSAYLTQYSHNWHEVARCAEASVVEDPTRCTFVPERPGSYRMTAAITDRAGREHHSQTSRWATGPGFVMWETPPGHSLPVEPEKSEVHVGETARFLVRNPFPGGRALFTVERLGVQTHWSRVLEHATEIVEIDVTEEHVPGFYVSVVVASPRVEPPPQARGEEDGTIDLGKPAMRVGYARVTVADPYKRVDVTVTPAQPTYRPRERARVDLLAKPAHPRPGRAEPVELAVAVLDEAVFDLLHQGRGAFDPYRGFYELGELDVENYNTLTHLIGIQKFEKKGANPGGDGLGPGSMRSLFRYVAYWNPSLRADAEGRASIEFELPDNLTGWRVLAMAVTPSDRMGLGDGTFATNQPIELRPALPNQVIEGDTFTARFTVMNRTDQPQHLTLQAKAAGPIELIAGLDTTTIDAQPFVRYPLSFTAKALRHGAADLVVSASSDLERDSLRVPLRVERAQAPLTVSTYGTTTEEQTSEQLSVPPEIRGDVGAVSVVLSPSVVGNVAGAFAYARDYPYLCWEQRLTKAVLARHYLDLRAYAPADFTWEGAEQWITRTLEDAAGFQAPNGGMAYWLAGDEHASPYLSAYTALGFAWLASSGAAIQSGVEARLHAYLDGLLRGDNFPHYYSPGMVASVRAVALAALAQRGRLQPADLDRHARALDGMSLFGKAHFLLAAGRVGRTDLAAEANRQIANHLDLTGGKVLFNESLDGATAHMHDTPQRSSCSILSALVANQDPEQAGATGDLPFRLARAIAQTREGRDHWQNTQDNVFCLNGLVDYSRVYEREPVAMTVTAALDGVRFGSKRFTDLRDGAATLERPLTAADPGRSATLTLARSGSGRLYYAQRLTYSPQGLTATAMNAGIELVREYAVRRGGVWQPLTAGTTLQRGELVRVDLFVSTPAARHFVVVDDPVPGGLEPVNRDLATASRADADASDRLPDDSTFYLHDDWQGWSVHWAGFYHRELGHGAARFYSDYLDRGRYHLSYAAQVIADGTFQALPAKAEEMYHPDVFGRTSGGSFVVDTTEGQP